MEVTLINILFVSLFESAISFYLFPHIFPEGPLTFFILLFSLLNFSVYAFYNIIIYPFFLSPLRHLPQPPRGFWPIFGHGMIMFERPTGAPHLRMIKETPNDGIIFFRGFFHVDRLLVTGPAALADVLVHRSYDFEKPPWTRAFLRIFLGDGLLVSEGEEHKHQRKHIMPAFSFRHIRELYPVFWAKATELCEVVKAELQETPDNVVDIVHFSTQVTMDIIGMGGLGRDIGSLHNSEDELVKNYEEILEPTLEKGLYFLFHLLFPHWLIHALPWKINEVVRATTANLKRICAEFVADKKVRMKRGDEQSVDILSTLLRSGDFGDEGLVDQLLTFLAAGHETTSSALTWATHLLATHPDIQTRLRAEIHSNIPEPKALSSPSFDIASLLESLPYLNAVCNEVLRLYPTIPLSARYAIRNTTVANQFIPKGTLLVITPWATNRDPKLWGSDAEEFKPSRWIDAETGRASMNGGSGGNYAFLTFLHGPRSCIGEKFARGEFRALVAAFVASFEMEMANPKEKILVGGTITSKPVQGMRLKLRSVGWGNEGQG